MVNFANFAHCYLYTCRSIKKDCILTKKSFLP